jgi:hypothetical protein
VKPSSNRVGCDVEACSKERGHENMFKIFVTKPERKRQLGRPTNRWRDNIKMGLEEVCFVRMSWIYVPQETI